VKEEIEELIRTNGEMGVNAIAVGISKPVSSVQKYLERQNYFLKTPNRKWELPERVMERVLSEFEGKSQDLAIREGLITIESTLVAMDAVKAKLSNVAQLLEKFNAMTKVQTPPVADKTKVNSKFEKRIIELDRMHKALKAHIDRVPDSYKELLSNLEYMEMAWRIGAIAMDEINEELTSLITGEKTELQESTIALFKQYQLGRKKSVMSDSDGEQSS
jgi:phosphatidylserine decarboxylase